MYIKEISIRNFRILSNATINPGKNLCLLIGRNNTGKTSFMVLFEKFLKQQSFEFNDFSISVRDQLLGFDKDTDEVQLAIQLILTIQYEDADDLCNLSEFIMDLEPIEKDVHLLFECLIRKDKLLEGIQNAGAVSKEKFIRKNISQYLERRFYAFESNDDLKPENRARLIKKEFKDIALFGDSMQSIYEDGVGDVEEYVKDLCKILYLILDYSHNHYTFKHFGV